MFLFVSLSLAKRHVEVLRRSAAGERRIANRGYRAEDAGVTLGLGLATATLAPLILVLYIIEVGLAVGRLSHSGCPVGRPGRPLHVADAHVAARQPRRARR